MSGKSLPQVPFGPYRISRLVIGGNPIRGNSHFSDDLNREMREWYTTENVLAAWFEAERQGLTAMQSRGDQVVMDWVDAYREAGGTLQWIVQTASEWKDGDVADNIRAIAAHGPIAIYHHGTRSDRLWKQGRIDEVHDLLKLTHDCGLLAGFGSHMPEVLAYAEEKGWEADFYMACAYNLSRENRESYLVAGGKAAAKQEVYDDADRETMAAFVRSTAKPCIFFKVFAARRKCATPETAREAIDWALAHIKPTDVIDVGVFQKHRNEIALDADWVRELTGRESSRAATARSGIPTA